MRQKTPFNHFRGTGPRQFLLLAFACLVGLAALFYLTEYSRTMRSMSYSAFLKNVELGQVKRIHIVGQKASGVLRDGRTYFDTTLPENNQHHWDLLRQHNVEISLEERGGTSSSGWYWIIIMALGSFAALLWLFLRQSRNSNSPGSALFNMGKSRAKMITPSQIKTNFSHVAGASDAKQELSDIIEFLKHPDRFKRLGARLPRGILLVGEPGNGKTLLAKAVAGEAECPFFMISGSDFVEVFVGVGAARIRDLFAQARKHVPSIVFIDEIDAIGRQRGTGLGGGNDEREQTLNQLLVEMDGFESQSTPIIIIAATNIPDVLDKALLRPGRFDRRIDVPFPDLEARAEIIRIHAHNVKFSPTIDIEKIAQDTAGFSGADLANLVNLAALAASKKGQDVVMPNDMEEARVKLFKSQESQNTTGALEGRGSIKAKLFMPQQVKTKFADVAGIKEAKEEVADVIDFLLNPAKFKQLGAKIPRGVLLIGDPGNGKTMLAKAMAGEVNRPFFTVSGSDFVEVFVGVGASRVRDLFAQARKHAPSIIFIDEIDSIGAQRMPHVGSHSEHDQTLNQLLAEMDGFDTAHADVIVVGATNRVDILDKALLRPGRFDRQVTVPYPELAAREEILRVHIRNIKIDNLVDLHKLARGTPGFSGADLANLVNEAAIFASKKSKLLVDVEDFDAARDKIILGKEMKSMVLSPKELKVTAFHEAGHALVNLLMPEVTDPLFKVTIIPRGASLGSTHWLPEREKYLSTKEEMLGSIMSALGGRIAEELVFDDISTGASCDFKIATSIAHAMVCSYGMSEALGPVSYKHNAYNEKGYSEETAHKIDQEVRTIVQTCYNKTKELLAKNRGKLEKLAHLLLEKETVHAQEIYVQLEIEPRTELSLT